IFFYNVKVRAAHFPFLSLFFFIIFNFRFVPGVRQAAWLTKSKVISGLPPHLLSLAEMPENQLPDQNERVQNTIKHARFWVTTEARGWQNGCPVDFTHLVSVCVSGDDLFQIRGQNGLLQSSMDPLPEVCGKQEVADTSNHVLETFYPVSPTIDLQQVCVYKEMSSTGFTDDSPYPHAHTLYFLESTERQYRLHPEQFKAKMMMFTFGNALARAHKLYGSVLDCPITIQAVGTNGRIFQFLVFQLNTTDLSGDDGIKNQVWLDEDIELYDFAKVRPLIKKKQVKVTDIFIEDSTFSGRLINATLGNQFRNHNT
uniref:Mitochondrial ribosomal protein L37 n=1 Tax=Kryptolebias marmoratus TaxID=37003 RepID=A0A3Q2ZDA3_KRYMA